MKHTLRIACLLLFFWGCQSSESNPTTPREENPAAPGFNAETSDAKAITLADSVMVAMGGRQAWDDTRYLRWTFFGRRTLLWDKQENRVRIDYTNNDSTVFILDMDTQQGMVKWKGEVVTDDGKRDTLLDQALGMWINDAYWLVMPFKLKDSGVTLTYAGQDTTVEGKTAEVLSLTFEGVGKTPQNKYLVYIDPASYLVVQWDYFRTADDSEPALQTPWLDYRKYGNIMLSGDRGRAKLTDIGVYSEVPERAFSSLDPVLANEFR